MSIRTLNCTGPEFDSAIEAAKNGVDFGVGELSFGGWLSGSQPNGDIVINTTSIVKHAFSGSASITSVTANNVTNVGDAAFQTCTGLKEIDMPELTIINGYAFAECAGLTHIVLPKVISQGQYAFYKCVNLKIVDYGILKELYTRLFQKCNSFDTLILRSTSLCVCRGTDSFTETPFMGYNGLTGTVYVPAALVESYKTATNWSTMYAAGTCNFVAIEGSEYE